MVMEMSWPTFGDTILLVTPFDIGIVAHMLARLYSDRCNESTKSASAKNTSVKTRNDWRNSHVPKDYLSFDNSSLVELAIINCAKLNNLGI